MTTQEVILSKQSFQTISSRLLWGSSRNRVSKGSVPDSCGAVPGTEVPKDLFRTPVGEPPRKEISKHLSGLLGGASWNRGSKGYVAGSFQGAPHN